jgi:hypothetical protein
MTVINPISIILHFGYIQTISAESRVLSTIFMSQSSLAVQAKFGYTLARLKTELGLAAKRLSLGTSTVGVRMRPCSKYSEK